MEIILATISIIFSVVAMFVSVLTWRRDFIATIYDVADVRLQDIHKIELEQPELHDPEWCRQAINSSDSKVRDKYDIFATIVWNFLETLYNRYGEKTLFKSPYYSAMKDLANRHSAWFLADDNSSFYNPNLALFLQVKKQGSSGHKMG